MEKKKIAIPNPIWHFIFAQCDNSVVTKLDYETSFPPPFFRYIKVILGKIQIQKASLNRNVVKNTNFDVKYLTKIATYVTSELYSKCKDLTIDMFKLNAKCFFDSWT